ncbi:hypothetical protein [Alteromonas halophila]|uniref:Uncharacterized protein n=1 Tax=Alteromonas halophila TaxID=516698 RepID=A0A918MZM3_9ALTE|nr:hypothetical protein [Alteromonas halophila]GGW87912.1 hypothetical protein GCM10007391_22070 [Alteromonas halophila]
MNATDLDTLMHDTARDAVDVARQEFDIALDYSKESVARVDDILLGFLDRYRDQALEDSAVFTLCNVFGAYVGEVFRNHFGGDWHYDKSNPDAPHVLLEIGNRSYAFAGICYERLVNDSDVSVNAYFLHAASQHSQ